MKKTTVGIYIFDSNNKLLLGHPTGHSKKSYSIPKGILEKGETIKECAIRELEEETSLLLTTKEKDAIIILGEQKYPHKKKKLIALYLKIERDLSNYPFECTSKILKKIYSNVEPPFPEFDEIGMFNLNEKSQYLHTTQQYFINNHFNF